MIARRILLRTARPRADSDASANSQGVPRLGKLGRVSPDVERFFRGRRVLDFGSGCGYEAIAIAQAGAQEVVGLDIQPDLLERGRALAEQYDLVDRVSFVGRLRHDERFDTIVSCNSFEHFSDPGAALHEMAHHLRPGGVALITFGPPWYAPYGAHMMHWCPIPWVHLLFSERAVMHARSRFTPDGAECYEECRGGLNRMSRAKFLRLVRSSQLVLESISYEYAAGRRLFGRLPLLNELLTNNIAAILRKPVGADAVRDESRPVLSAPLSYAAL